MLADEWNFCWRGWEEQTEKPGNISVGRMGMQIQTAAQSYSKGYYYVCMTVFYLFSFTNVCVRIQLTDQNPLSFIYSMMIMMFNIGFH